MQKGGNKSWVLCLPKYLQQFLTLLWFRVQNIVNFILLIVPRRYFCCGSNWFGFWSRNLCCLSLMYVFVV